MSNDTYTFTKATPQDIPFLDDMECRIYAHNYTSFFGEKFVGLHIQSGQIRKELEENIEHCIIMHVNNVPVGFSIIIEDKIRDVMIDVEYQHKSHGSALLKYVEGILFEKYETIELRTYKTNVNAVKFYGKHNWIQIPRGLLGSNIVTFQKKKGL
jgi:GNAT superfamily N-acetyltransferase